MLTRRQMLVLALLNSTAASTSWAASKGEYRGPVVAEWLSDNRKMKLFKSFEYIAPDGRRWPVPAGTIVDGASIPQVLWPVIGGPFVGAYRDASVVHDYYCDIRTRRFKDVHKVFYDAMRTSGVGEARASFMYLAVDRFGPTWDDPKIDPRCEVVDENYDVDLCARNWRKPAVKAPIADREALLRFASEMEGTADPADLQELRKAIENMK